jgi:glycosyltransferase involved in cell wall biosynthesis
MPVLGVIPEPPFHPASWSGSAARFFGALRTCGIMGEAAEVRLSSFGDAVQKLRVLAIPMERWRAQYHASVPRFTALTEVAKSVIAHSHGVTGVLQIGAWFSSGAATDLPCFSYHDGNAALWYRYYGRSLLSDRAVRAHLQWERSVYTKLQAMFVMSSWLAASFMNDFSMPSARVHVVGAGINIDRLPVVPERDFSHPRFLFVGRDFARKGGKSLLEAFRTVRARIRDAELVIVGPSLDIQDPGIICEGFLSKSDPGGASRLHMLFSNATAVVLPSIYEPFGISLIEGMAYGLPCVATDRCAMPEIVRHGESGLIVAADDSNALARAMLEIAESPAAAAEMGAVGRQRAEQEFTWGAVSRKIQTILGTQYHVQ